jgi:hypothetical protein
LSPPGTYTASKRTEPTVSRLQSTDTACPRAPVKVPSLGATTFDRWLEEYAAR